MESIRINRTWWTVLIIIASLCTKCDSNSYQCTVDIQKPIKTRPKRHIDLNNDEPMEILCILNETWRNSTYSKANSSDLVIFRNGREIEAQNITVVNKTTIALSATRHQSMTDTYTCKLRQNDGAIGNEDVVCHNKAVFEFTAKIPKPRLSCVSHNMENLICSWEPLQNNATAHLFFRDGQWYSCPERSKNVQPNTCLWDADTTPHYKKHKQIYLFLLNGTSIQGNFSFHYQFNYFAHVIPSNPIDVSCENVTSESAVLNWTVPDNMLNINVGFHHRVSYKSEFDDEKSWQVIEIKNETTLNLSFNLTRLKCANAEYNINISVKTAVATDEDKWSSPSSITFTTAPTLPGLPPRTDFGSFAVIDYNSEHRIVYLLWQTIPACRENGNNFAYQVATVEENGSKIDLKPDEILGRYAKFTIMSNNHYRFEIETRNDVGANEQRAVIHVPSKEKLPPEPLYFMAIELNESRSYLLVWEPPISTATITNYTIFWCEEKIPKIPACTGHLDWTHVPNNMTNYNITNLDPQKTYDFAISANTEHASSGMFWTKCKAIPNKAPGKVRFVNIQNITSNSVGIDWGLECEDRIDIVEGINIHYCPVAFSDKSICIEPELMKTIRVSNSQTTSGTVHGMKPVTTYKLAVAVLWRSGEGLLSEFKYFTTLEGAPTPPLDVKVSNVTNTTMDVSWREPEVMNGVLRYYKVHLNSDSLNVTNTSKRITNLSSHTNYSISVSACTVECSLKSDPIYKVTAVGIPGKVDRPEIRFNDTTNKVQIKWREPQAPAGDLNYYEISDDRSRSYISKTNVTSIPIDDCSMKFRVRAVNIAPDETVLEGPWSEFLEAPCSSSGIPDAVKMVLLIMGILGGIPFVLFLAHFSKRMWLKYNEMQDVEVKLPPGLEPNSNLLQNVEKRSSPPSSADSSGYSSEQTTMNSSLTTGPSDVSTDDSVEVALLPTSLIKTLKPPQTWESHSLDQTTRRGILEDSAHCDPYFKITKTSKPSSTDNLYLAESIPNSSEGTGCAKSQQKCSATGYISMSPEKLVSNPSSVPKESSNIGDYSRVSIAPKYARRKSVGNIDSSGNLNSLQAEAKPIKAYISLVSLNRKEKEANTTNNSSFRFDNVHSAVPIITSNPEELALCSVPNKEPKPYVRMAMRTSMK